MLVESNANFIFLDYGKHWLVARYIKFYMIKK